MDTVSACFRAFYFSVRPLRVGGRRGRPEPARPGWDAPGRPGHPSPPPSPQRVFPGSATAAHGRPRRRCTPGSPASRSQAPGAGAAGAAREPRTHPTRPGPAAQRRLRGAAPPAAPAPLPLPATGREVSARPGCVGPGQSRSRPPQRPSSPATPGHGGG